MELKFMSVVSVRLQAAPGSHIDRSLREAAQYALENNVVVILVHNDREHEIDPQSVFAVLTGTGKVRSVASKSLAEERDANL